MANNAQHRPITIEFKMRTLFATKDSDLSVDLRFLLRSLNATIETSGESPINLSRLDLSTRAGEIFGRQLPALPDNFTDSEQWLYWKPEQTRDGQRWWRQVRVTNAGVLPSASQGWDGNAWTVKVLISPKAGPLPSHQCALGVFRCIAQSGNFDPPLDYIAAAEEYTRLAKLEWEVEGANPVLKYGENTAYVRNPDDVPTPDLIMPDAPPALAPHAPLAP